MRSKYLALAWAVLSLLDVASAQKEKVLFSFDILDGANPVAGVTLDKEGNLYGTTPEGGRWGTGGLGVIFRVTPSGDGSAQYDFCSLDNCADGAVPSGGVLIDDKGNLYGTTSGSDINFGNVFKLTPAHREIVLHKFGRKNGDGAYPAAGLIEDQSGNMYGTTSAGGTDDQGTIFKITKSGKETVLYSFQGGADGSQPVAGLVLDNQNNLYGTTRAGGEPNNEGVVFKLTPAGDETVLYTFCPIQKCTDGAASLGSLVLDAQGNLYGTANSGGAYDNGVVFKVTSSGEETVLYSFTGKSDGGQPAAGLVFGTDGNLYGTTVSGGGANNDGTIFKVTPTGDLTTLYQFPGAPNGAGPYAALIFDRKGNLYGTTYGGGAGATCGKDGCGTVFELTP